MDVETRTAFKKLTNVIEKMDARMERGFASVAEDIGDLRTELKGDIAALGEQLTSMEAELRGINRDRHSNCGGLTRCGVESYRP
jgi:hypothetical protein